MPKHVAIFVCINCVTLRIRFVGKYEYIDCGKSTV